MTEPVATSPAPEEELAALLAPDGRQDPYPHYEALRAHGEVVGVRPGLMATVGYTHCARALRESRLEVQDANSYDLDYPEWRSHSSLRGWTDSMLYTNPPDHTRLRRLVSGVFTFRRVMALQHAIERMTDRLLDRMAEIGAGGATVDFMAEFAYRLPVAVIGELLGVPEEDHRWFRDAAADVTLALEGITNETELAVANAAMDGLSHYFTSMIDHRRRRPADDLISDLVQVHDTDGDRLSQAELIGNLVLLLAAGFDTTTHLLGHGLNMAFQCRAYIDRLAIEPDFATGYVEECLRYEPPVQATTRWAADDVDLLGTRVPTGTKVLVLLAAGNRDPARYHLPQVFDPGRRDVQPLSFGAGGHFCLGAALARLEARTALPRLFRRFPDLYAAGTAIYRDRWLVRGHETFPVALS